MNIFNFKKLKMSNLFNGYYFSADNTIKEDTRGSRDEFKKILGGTCETYKIGQNYEIIYNTDKNLEKNKFLSSFIQTTIRGSIIIYNTGNNNQVTLKEIRKSLVKHKQYLNFINNISKK